MGLAVVRCPECRGSSQVESNAIGLTVRCPRCDATFDAVEEVEIAIPVRAPRNPTLPTPERTPRSDRPRRRSRREREPEQPPEPDHDPHRIPTGPLPISVLIGLALLPFAIPVLWLVGPALIGEPPMLSIATPIALAVSASILCLAVIYTIDWTPTTRVKGVLMLVSVTYFAAVNLYFLKKEMVERVKKVTGLEDLEWQYYRSETGGYSVRMPGHAMASQDQPVPQYKLDCVKVNHATPLRGQYDFVVGFSKLPPLNKQKKGELGSADWYDNVISAVVQRSGGELKSQQELDRGREIAIKLPGQADSYRVVRLYVIQGYLYYLAVQGRGMHDGDDDAKRFFDSFDCEREKN